MSRIHRALLAISVATFAAWPAYAAQPAGAPLIEDIMRSVRASESARTQSIAETVKSLKPGQFLWMPQVAPEGPVLVWVNLSTQRALVYRNGVPIGVTTVSTGKTGYETPTGVFSILQKQVEHKSNLYEDAPMPFMQRLTWTGVALHAGRLPGYPASHGCVRLPAAFAKLLFSVTRIGLTVVITKNQPLPHIAPQDNLIGIDWSVSDDNDTIWRPELAPDGPVSILVSAPDRRVTILRSGRVIGSAPAEIHGPVAAATAFLLHHIAESGPHWLGIRLPGDSDSTDERYGATEQWFSVSAAFADHLRSTLAPGTILIITPDSLHPGDGTRSVTVLEGASR